MNVLTQRRQQQAIRAMLLHRMLPLWTLLDPQHLDTSLPSWLSAVIPVVTDSRKASALIAAAYLREARKAAGIDGTAPVVLAATAAPEQVLTALTVTSLVTVRRALGAGQTVEQAMRTGYVTSSGAASRLALQGGQQTIVDSVRADPKARGWQRVTSGDPCAFCAMLASRGAVYKSEDSGSFESHDHCACVAEPIYAGSGLPRGDAAGWHRLYQEHAADSDKPLKAFRRAYDASRP